MKLEFAGSTQPPLDPDEPVEAIIQVREADYVPAEVRVRARIDATMFTAELAAGALDRVQADPRVVSVALSRRLRLIE